MQDLYLDKKSEEQLKQNVNEYTKGKLRILRKINNDIMESLLIYLIKDVSHIVIDYTEMIFVDYTYYPQTHENIAMISISCNNVFIDDLLYNFKYQIEITNQQKCKLIQVESDGFINIHRNTNYHKSYYDMLLFFNKYYLVKYNQPNYIKYSRENDIEFCKIGHISLMYLVFNAEDYDCIKIDVINSKKLENVINICKLLIDTICSTRVKN